MPLKDLDVVRLTEDHQALVTLPKGLRGTIVHAAPHAHRGGSYEVEFCDDEGRGVLVTLFGDRLEAASKSVGSDDTKAAVICPACGADYAEAEAKNDRLAGIEREQDANLSELANEIAERGSR